MRRLLDASLEHRLVVIVLALLLAGAGWAAFLQLPIDAFPDVTNIQVTVISQAPTLSPLEIEQLVTYPIEQACAGLPRSSQLRSLSKFGLSMVTVVFEDGTDHVLRPAAGHRAAHGGAGGFPRARRADRPDHDRDRRGLPVRAREPGEGTSWSCGRCRTGT